MKVTCSRCGTEYNFDDSKVSAEEGVKVKCTRCDNVFRVRKKAYAITEPETGVAVTGGAISAPMEDVSAPTYTGATARQWMIRRSTGETMEFKEMTTLQRWIVERRVSASDEISHNGVKWKRLGAIPELAPFFKVVEDEDAASEAEREKAAPRGTPPASRGSEGQTRDPRMTTQEFLRAQAEADEDRTQPIVVTNGNGAGKSTTPLDAWADEKTSRVDPASVERERKDAERDRKDAERDRKDAERDRRDAERPTHDPSRSERSVERAVTPRKSRRGLFLALGLVVILAAGFGWAQFTESGLVASAPARAWLLAMLGAAPAGTPTPIATPTAVAAASPTPEETPVAPVSPVATATPDAAPTEVAPVTPAPTATAAVAPTKIAKLSVDKLLQQGFEAYSRGRYREAINKYQAAVNADSDNSEAYALLGLAYLDSGNDDLAESSLEAAIRLNPRFADAHRYLGMLYSRRGDKARAIASFNTYLGLRPNGPTSDDVRRRVTSLGG